MDLEDVSVGMIVSCCMGGDVEKEFGKVLHIRNGIVFVVLYGDEAPTKYLSEEISEASEADQIFYNARNAVFDNPPLARQLATDGSKQFPDHELLGRLARLLAPPKRVGPPVPADPKVKLNHQWLKDHENDPKYKGKWVALNSGVPVQVSDSMSGVKSSEDGVIFLVVRV